MGNFKIARAFFNLFVRHAVAAGNLPDRLDSYADKSRSGSQQQADLYAAATHLRKLPHVAGVQPSDGGCDAR